MKTNYSSIANFNAYTENIPDILLKNAINSHKLPNKIKVQYLWQSPNSSESLIITPNFISVLYKDSQATFNFHEIKKVELGIGNYFFVYDLNMNSFGKIPTSFFDLEDKISQNGSKKNDLQDFLNYVIYNKHVDEVYRLNESTYEVIDEIIGNRDISTLNDIEQNEIADNIITIYDHFVKNYGEERVGSRIYYFLVLSLLTKKEFLEALEIVELVFKEFEDLDFELWYSLKAEILLEANKPYEAFIYLTKALKICSDTVTKLDYKEGLKEIQETFNDNFINLPYAERKLILIDNDLKSTPEDTFIVLDKNNLPPNIKFPNNDPKIRELYIAHPYIKGSYLPFSDYETNLSSDKFDEFFYFVQCLGAKKITYRIIKGNNTNQTKNSNLNVDLSIGVGKGPVKNAGSGAFERDKKQNQQEDNFDSRAKTQTFNPVKAPYIPNDLLWYPHEQTWNRLYQQRINGNILDHNEVISSKSALSVSNSEKNNLKLAFKNYFVDAGLNVNHSIEETFEQNESVEWEISIEFESIANLTEQSTAITEVSSDFEKEYLEEVKFMLEDDGVIDDKERSILERFRVKKGISKERAIDIENNLTSLGDLNENEKEYLDEYQELLNDGEITEKERRILNRMAIRYDISEQRVIELENR
ncbi:hypothetical protein ABF179_002371 [Flavobacterium psychrophilum]|nr:hypothetical protein [Flavobacterium psychrophilum]